MQRELLKRYLDSHVLGIEVEDYLPNNSILTRADVSTALVNLCISHRVPEAISQIPNHEGDDEHYLEWVRDQVFPFIELLKGEFHVKSCC